MRYKTRYVLSRRGGRRRAQGHRNLWIMLAVAAGAALYLALALGAGEWMYETIFAKEETVQEDELSDGETGMLPQPTPASAVRVTETVAFPSMEVYALCVPVDAGTEQQRAVEMRAMGGAGYVAEEGVLLAAYDSRKECESVAQTLAAQQDIQAQVCTLSADAVELKITAQPRRIDGVRDAFAIWQQTVQMLIDLWQDVDGGLCTAQQAVYRLETQCEKLRMTQENAFSGALYEGESGALEGLGDVTRKLLAEMERIVADPPQNVLEVSAQIKYTGIGSLTEYQSYVAALKAELT